MIDQLKARFNEFQNQSPKDIKKLLALSDDFLSAFPSGAQNQTELDFAIGLFRSLVDLTYVTSLREYEHDHKLYREILQKKVRVFKRCIPKKYEEVRGLTELLLGMNENELN